MSNILDIGRSGILAYRTALATTAENIANVHTEGYRRRDVATVSATGAQSTPTTLPTGGQGVTTADVRRAFDALVADRARRASGGQAAAEAHLSGAQAIETLMIPGDDGIDGTLRNFFDSLSRLAASPTDATTRTLVLQQGQALTTSVSGLAREMEVLRRDILGESAEQVRNAQRMLEGLAQLSRPLSEMPQGDSGGHSLADRRDALLDQLARILPISVTLNGSGQALVRLGGETGPVLLDRGRTANLSVSAPDLLTLHVDAADGTTHQTRLLPSGSLGGMSRAMGALDMARSELDAFAREMTSAMNRVHRGGVDLRGLPGGDLFAIDGWRAQPAASNAGRVQVTLTNLSAAAARLPIELVFDGAEGLWRARDAAGAELGRGRDQLLLDGVLVDLAGTARDGDRIALTPVTGRAADLRLALTDPAALAAASAFASAAAPSNLGSASLTATFVPAPAAQIPALGPLLDPAGVDLLGGVVGLVPTGTQVLRLASLGQPASSSVGPVAGAGVLEVDGAVFDLTDIADAAAISGALTDGRLRTGDGRSLSQMGMVALADGDLLVLTRPGNDQPPQVRLTGPAGSIDGVPTQGAAPGGTVQILTRNGRHIAGSPLTPAEATALLTARNGFLPDAVYDPTPLTSAGTEGYRGVELGGLGTSAQHGAVLGGAGTRFGAALPLPPVPARSLTLIDASGAAADLTLPEGASAAQVAGRMQALIPGLSAQASTALELSGFQAGPVSFELAGLNGTPLRISARLAGPDAAPLAQAVNALGIATGIRAELSPDGSRLLLVQDGGHDIGLLALTGGALSVAGATAAGARLSAPAEWAAGSALRQSGQVSLAHLAGFQLTEGPSTISAAPATGGLVAVSTSAAGAAVRLTFADVPALAQGGILHRVSLNGIDAQAAFAPGTSAQEMAVGLARLLRAGAPEAVVTGRALARLPPDGATLSLRLDGGDYTLRMERGAPVISGPEPDRITARFDAQNRLVLRAAGAGGGIGTPASPAFGLGLGEGRLTLTGQPTDGAMLPADLPVTVGGATHVLRLLADGSVQAPAEFPGLATRDGATGALLLEFAAPASGLQIATVPAAGFGGPGAAVRAEDGRLILAGPGAALDLAVETRGSLARQIDLRNLPPEDLVVAMTGQGTLRLAGDLTAGAAPAHPGALEVMVADAATGRLVLRDSLTRHVVAEGRMDAAGRGQFGGLTVQFGGQPQSGDRFSILPAGAASGNGDTARAMARLQVGDAASGTPGLGDRLSRLQADTGLRVAAARRSLATADATAEAAERAQAAIGAVNLDAEAARLVELQQAYQASAQAVTIARELFDTILRMF
ncbi:FlgK family flagellar hook-associated protein [Paracoccus sp. T5]|uniref:FlgK family flagellar hook-associated protein n=1 Tax=Paracoccus sp. T5 TaxID=3402161 RepID=UPI003AD9B085